MFLHRIASPEHYAALSAHPRLSIAEVVAHPEKPWRWDVLSKHPNLSVAIVEQFPDNPWDWKALSSNPGITMADVERHPNWPWHRGMGGLSSNPSLTMSYVKKYPDDEWDWCALSANPGITMADVEQHIHDLDDSHHTYWEWGRLHVNPNFTLKFLDKHLYYCEVWDWEEISLRPDVTCDFVAQHREWHWDWYSLSSKFTTLDVDQHPDWPWVWSFFLKHHTPSEVFLDRYFKKIIEDSWSMSELYTQPHFTEALVEKYVSYPKVARYFSKSVNLDLIDRHPDVGWNWKEILLRPDLTLNFVLRNEKHYTDRWAFSRFIEKRLDSVIPPEWPLPWGIGVAIDGSPWIPGTEFCKWIIF